MIVMQKVIEIDDYVCVYMANKIHIETDLYPVCII